MPVSPNIQEFLRLSEVEYTVFPHDRAYTAAREAETASIPKRNWAKVVVCFAGGEPIQAVVPADCDVDLVQLAGLAKAPQLRLATEDELDWLYPDCEPGAMPPFGPLFRQMVFVDERLAADEFIAFNAGTYEDGVAMRFEDFQSLTCPTIGRFARAKERRL